MSEHWEYKHIECEVGMYCDEFVEIHLKPAGEDGWELIHIVEFPMHKPNTVLLKGFLKRRLAEAEALGFGKADG